VVDSTDTGKTSRKPLHKTADIKEKTYNTQLKTNKFTSANWTKSGIDKWPIGVNKDLIGAAYAKNSWERYNSSINCFKKFAYRKNSNLKFPVSKEFLREFVSWAVVDRKLKTNKIKLYLSDLKLAHKLRDLDISQFNDFFIKTMLKGAENLGMYKKIINNTKLVMSFSMLKILGHEINKSNWNNDKKKLIWAISCIAFFGSFRMGELLPKNYSDNNFEKLTWHDVNFRRDGSVLLNVKFPKHVKNSSGDFIDLFPIEGKKYCPVTLLKNIHKNTANFEANKPVFSYTNGKTITTGEFTSSVKSLLEPIFGDKISNLSGHSFRAGVPAALSSCPDIATETDVSIWGRWSSSAYKAYTKLKQHARQLIFNKILTAVYRC